MLNPFAALRWCFVPQKASTLWALLFVLHAIPAGWIVYSEIFLTPIHPRDGETVFLIFFLEFPLGLLLFPVFLFLDFLLGRSPPWVYVCAYGMATQIVGSTNWFLIVRFVSASWPRSFRRLIFFYIPGWIVFVLCFSAASSPSYASAVFSWIDYLVVSFTVGTFLAFLFFPLDLALSRYLKWRCAKPEALPDGRLKE